MFVDANTIMSNAQAITASAASTEYINRGAKGSSVAHPTFVVVQTGDAFNTLTSLTIALQCHEDSAFGTGVKTLVSTSVLLAGLTANTRVFAVQIPPGCEQYLRLYYTVVGTNPTTGTLNAFLTDAIPVGEVADA